MRGFTFVLCLALLAGLAGAALADGMIFPNPISAEQPFSVKYHRVKVEINDQAARTSVDQAFLNHSGRPLEATYLFPLPEDAHISKFLMYEGDKAQTGELLNKEEAVKVYEGIVRKQRDPGLLEYVGRNTIRARIFPVPPSGEKRFRVEYSELLRMDAGLVRYIYPLSTERFSARPLEQLTIEVELNSAGPIKNIYSPSHDVSIKRLGDRKAVVSFEASQVKPATDFVLYYSVSPQDVGLTLLSYREASEQGYWMLLASPKMPNEKEVIAKDVIFVLDRTGSMSGEKIQQAKGALRFCLNSLNPRDRFEIVAFNESPETFGERLLPASALNVKKGLSFVDDFKAQGSTDIDQALSTALGRLEKSERPRYVVFLTDGLPTSGETNIDTILKHVKTKNEGRARIFVFGVGFDVDVHFLDRLAEENSGVSEYVRPAEDIEAKVSTFFNKVSAPVMTDIAVEVGGSKVSDVFPRKNFPDLFEGSQLIVVGSYRQSGPVTIKLSGEVAGRKRTFELQGKLAQYNEEHDFVPLVWASRKIGYLMDEVRLHGQNQELVDEIIRLSKEFGIMTEFTAFLVTEPNLEREEANRRTLDQVSRAKAARSGAWATGQAQNARRLSAAAAPQAMGGGKGGFDSYSGFGAAAPAALPSGGIRSSNQAFLDAEGRVQAVQGVQNVSNRAFYQQGKVWVDQSVTAKMPVVRIQQYSKASFQLAAASKQARRFLAVGDEVKFVLNGQAVVIGPQGKTELTEGELKKLVGAKPAASSQRPELNADQMQAMEKYTLPLIIGILAAPAIVLRRRRKIA